MAETSDTWKVAAQGELENTWNYLVERVSECVSGGVWPDFPAEGEYSWEDFEYITDPNRSITIRARSVFNTGQEVIRKKREETVIEVSAIQALPTKWHVQISCHVSLLGEARGLWNYLCNPLGVQFVKVKSAEPSAGEAYSLQRQLADARENLRVIEEHKAQYVREVDIPLQDIKDERRLKEQITEIERKLGASGPSEEYT